MDLDVMRYIGGVRDQAQTVDYLARNLRHWDEYGFGLWILRERGGGDPLGTAVLRHLLVDDVDEVEVGYAFYQPHWGRGLASEITNVCLAFAWDALLLSSIVGVTHPDNAASQHVLTKAGLVFGREFMLEGERCFLFRARSPHGEPRNRGENPPP